MHSSTLTYVNHAPTAMVACPICTDAVAANAVIVSCHETLFCAECIGHWLGNGVARIEKKVSCPTCRNRVDYSNLQAPQGSQEYHQDSDMLYPDGDCDDSMFDSDDYSDDYDVVGPSTRDAMDEDGSQQLASEDDDEEVSDTTSGDEEDEGEEPASSESGIDNQPGEDYTYSTIKSLEDMVAAMTVEDYKDAVEIAAQELSKEENTALNILPPQVAEAIKDVVQEAAHGDEANGFHPLTPPAPDSMAKRKNLLKRSSSEYVLPRHLFDTRGFSDPMKNTVEVAMALLSRTGRVEAEEDDDEDNEDYEEDE